MEAATHAHQVQLIVSLNETLLALHAELHDIAQSQKQVKKHAQQQAKDEKMYSEVITPISKAEGEAREISSIVGSDGDRTSASAGISSTSKDRAKTIATVSSSPRFDTAKMPVASSGTGSSSGGTAPTRTHKALVFTMDSISAYEADSRRGGAAGEIRVRESLQHALKQLGVEVKVAASDEEFDAQDGAQFDHIIVDPWTWAASGWVTKRLLRGLDHKVYVLDFFGAPKLRGTGLNVPANRFLTAFGSQWNTFLGYSMAPAAPPSGPKKNQGVIWGKNPKHFIGKERMLRRAADFLSAFSPGKPAMLASTATKPVFQHASVQWLGHQTGQQWNALLRESKFLIGLGDPLLGPSALDAIAAGCMYINPSLNTPVKGSKSQHPWAADNIGEPYVCSYEENDADSLNVCIAKAMAANLTPLVPAEFTPDVYLQRVKTIFGL